MQRRLLLSLVISGWTSFAVCAQKPELPESQRVGIGKTAIDVPNTLSKSVDTYRAGFIENKGQLVDQNGKPNGQVRYLLQSGLLNVQLRQNGFSYDTYLRKGAGSRKFHRVDIEFAGANPAATLKAEMPGYAVSNVINERGEFRNIRNFQCITYTGIYPGIDLEFVADPKSDKNVEYNFIVHPGADPARIQLRYRGGRKVALRQDRIIMETDHGQLQERIPASWVGDKRKPVAVSYKALGENLFAFQVPAYDKRQTLVIDPSPNLEWATYYVNGILTDVILTGQNVANVNFGIQQPPLADLKDFQIDRPTPDATITLDGTHISTGAGTSSPGGLTGTDEEDGSPNGSGRNRTVVITALPGIGELYYNGTLITQGQVIPSYDPALMTIKLTGTGYTNVTFEYAYLDEAGEQSPSASYTVRWEGALPVKLVSFSALAHENVVELNWFTTEETGGISTSRGLKREFTYFT